MFVINDIHPLTDFQRNAKMHIERLKETGRPEILTVNGKAEIVIQDAQSYQQLLNEVKRLEVLATVNAGLQQAREGKVAPADEAFTKIRSKLKIPKSK